MKWNHSAPKYASTWSDLETVTLSERRQAQNKQTNKKHIV